MKVAVIQLASGSNKETNIAQASRLVQKAAKRAVKFVVLPEVFNYRGTEILPESTTGESIKALKEVNKELEKMGVKVVEQYAVLGPYDFVNIVEAPNNEAISKVAIELGSRGTLKLMTLAAIPINKFVKNLK